MTNNRFYYGWVIVAVSFLMLLMTSGIVMSFGVFMKSLVEEFSWDRTSVSMAVATFMIVQGFLSPMVGRFIDRYGPKKVIAGGVLILGLTMILFSYINSYVSFFIVYGLLAAVGYSTTTLMTNSVLISKWFKEKKGLALGISTTGFPLGPLVFAPLIGYLILKFDWRWTVFGLGLLLILVLIPLIMIFVKEKDVANSDGDAGKGQLKASITFKKLLGNNQYLKLAGAYFGCGFTMSLVTTHFPIHAMDLGLTEFVAAIAFGLMGGFAALGTISAGALSDKYGRKNLLAVVYFTRFLALSTFTFATNPSMLYIGAVIFGISWTATGPLTTAITGDIWGTKVMGTVFGYIFLFHQFGAATGAYLGGIIFDYSNSYQLAFLLGAIILFISAVNSYLLDESKGKQCMMPLIVERGVSS